MQGVLGGSGDLVSRVISTLTKAISRYDIVTVFITLLTKSPDPPSKVWGSGFWALGFRV